MKDKEDILDMTLEEIEKSFEGLGLEKYRAKQVFQWLHKGVTSFEDMTNLSKQLRQTLAQHFYINMPVHCDKFVSKYDETTKYLLSLNDGNIIESVLMKYKHGNSACISSQVGCRMGCKFCASTGLGFVRNLTASEMLGQVLHIKKDSMQRVNNIVVMGIGEPLENYDNLIKFIRLVNHKDGLNIGLRHISVSTCGLVPEIIKLSKEGLPITLSISLHAPDDEIRSKLMPVNKIYNIDILLDTCKIYTEATKRRITFEYAMINGVNDSEDNAKDLAQKLKGMLCHVNIIPINEVHGTGFKKANRKDIKKFKNILEMNGIETTVRRELGSDIEAACGQLRKDILK